LTEAARKGLALSQEFQADAERKLVAARSMAETLGIGLPAMPAFAFDTAKQGKRLREAAEATQRGKHALAEVSRINQLVKAVAEGAKVQMREQGITDTSDKAIVAFLVARKGKPSRKPQAESYTAKHTGKRTITIGEPPKPTARELYIALAQSGDPRAAARFWQRNSEAILAGDRPAAEGPTWLERYAQESDSKKRAAIFAEHGEDILAGK
jgi:hypothetical protein